MLELEHLPDRIGEGPCDNGPPFAGYLCHENAGVDRPSELSGLIGPEPELCLYAFLRLHSDYLSAVGAQAPLVEEILKGRFPTAGARFIPRLDRHVRGSHLSVSSIRLFRYGQILCLPPPPSQGLSLHRDSIPSPARRLPTNTGAFVPFGVHSECHPVRGPGRSAGWRTALEGAPHRPPWRDYPRAEVMRKGEDALWLPAVFGPFPRHFALALSFIISSQLGR